MKTLFGTFILLVLCNTLRATSQVPENMTFEGQAFDMYATPLDLFFGDRQGLPRHLRERPSPTDCHRGYIGSWKIDFGKLYLVSVVLGYQRDTKIPLTEISSDWEAPVFARWFSGSLRLGRGDLIMGGMGFSEVRSEELLLEIQNGVVRNVQKKTNQTN
jgi:hypothetical protein